jgi:hypothetical protein
MWMMISVASSRVHFCSWLPQFVVRGEIDLRFTFFPYEEKNFTSLRPSGILARRQNWHAPHSCWCTSHRESRAMEPVSKAHKLPVCT